MKLKELSKTVVHCKTKEEYDRLVQVLNGSGLWWRPGHDAAPKDGFVGYETTGVYLEVRDDWNRQNQASDGQKVVSLADFLRAQGIDEKPTIEIGKKYRLKETRVNSCGYLDDRRDIAYIIFNKHEKSGKAVDTYTAYSGTGVKIAACGCWDYRDVEPYEEETTDFKAGDWVEAKTEFHSNRFSIRRIKAGERLIVDAVDNIEPRCRLVENGCLVAWANTSDLRKCSRLKRRERFHSILRPWKCTEESPATNALNSFPKSLMSTCSEAVKNGVQFLRDGLLTDGELALRKVGFKDSNGQWTGIEVDNSSAVAAMCQLLLNKYEKELTDLAEKMVAAEDKKKKK